MARTRLYQACWDDGHDYGCFEFYSDHRANSKANIEDAKTECARKYGQGALRHKRILSTQLQEER